MSQFPVTAPSTNFLQRGAAEMPVVPPAPITVFGGSGTGKTHTCLARALHLLESGVAPRQIAYLSASPRMAGKFREMLLRLPKEYSGLAQEMLVGTPVQIAVFYLRALGAETLGLPREFSLWDRARAGEVISAIWGRGEGEEPLDPGTIAEILDWNALDRAMDGRRQGPLADQHWRRVLDRYAREKMACRALDVADVRPMAIRAIDQDPNKRVAFTGERTLHLLVDGMQDLTPVDRALLDRLTREHGSLLVTWDPNQGITEPFGADMQSPWPARDAWEPGSRHNLQLIHGATRPLAEAARRLAASPAMTGLSDYGQGALRVRGGSPPVIRRFGASDEADAFLLRELGSLPHDDGIGWSGVAVICRDPADVPRVRWLLESRDIPCEVAGVPEPLDQDAHRLVCLIASVLNPLDATAFAAAAFGEDATRWVVARHVMETLTAIVRDQQVDLFQAARQQLGNFGTDGVVHNGLNRMIQASKMLRLSSSESALPELCWEAMTLFGGVSEFPLSRSIPAVGHQPVLALPEVE